MYCKMSKNLLGAIQVLLLSVLRISAQDIHFSNIHASPVFLNPAMTGIINARGRGIAIARSQWQLNDKGYQSVLSSADTRLFKGLSGNDDFGIGLQLTTDRAGDLQLSSTEAAFSVAYLKALNRNGDHLVSFGLKYALVQQRIDLDNLKVFQPDPFFEDPDFSPVLRYFDLSLGLGWFYPIDRNNNLYLGASLFHLNAQTLSFERNRNAIIPGAFQYRKYVIHGGASIRLNSGIDLLPSLVMARQGPHYEMSMGAYLRLSRGGGIKFSSDVRLYGGLWGKVASPGLDFQRDAIIVAFRLDYLNFQTALAFDLTISEYAAASKGFGGPELSLIYLLENPKGKKSRVVCPGF
jgi:type IX secretion system PorP/SprF family membrane protein